MLYVLKYLHPAWNEIIFENVIHWMSGVFLHRFNLNYLEIAML